MSRRSLYDVDGIDGPFERGMAEPIPCPFAWEDERKQVLKCQIHSDHRIVVFADPEGRESLLRGLRDRGQLRE